MKSTLKILILGFFLSLFSFTTFHKYYVSVSEVDYSAEEQALQISSRLFVDDMENLLKERYDEKLTIDNSRSDYYLNRYFKQKFKVYVNKKEQELNFIGREIEDDLIYCYFEIKNITSLKSIKISNEVLFDLYSDQQNVIHLDVQNKKKSFLLIKDKSSGLLNF